MPQMICEYDLNGHDDGRQSIAQEPVDDAGNSIVDLMHFLFGYCAWIVQFARLFVRFRSSASF